VTGMERLTAALTGTPADRIPVFCNLLDQGAQELGMPPKQYFQKGEYVAEAQLRMRHKYGYDNLWSLFYVGKEAELMGCRKILFSDDGPPNVGETVIRSPEDIDRLEVPGDVASHPAFQEVMTCVRILRKEAGRRHPICAYITASMTLPSLLMGMEKWLPMLLWGPAELRDQLMEKCHRLIVAEAEAYRHAGADLLLYSNPFGSTDQIPMKFFRECSLPWIAKDVAAIGTGGLVYYCGGSRVNPVVDQVLQRTGIGAYYLSPLDDLSEAQKIVAGRALCWGTINDIKMIDWKEDEVVREVQRIIDAGRPNGTFGFGTLVMPKRIPESNIRAMLNAAYRYGGIEQHNAAACSDLLPPARS
jgi:uroporphyrinogen-III decarboxylase